MKRLVGIFIIVQVFLTGMILYALNEISVSIIKTSIYIKEGNATLSWSDNLSSYVYLALVAILIVGIYLILVRENKPK